MIASIMAAALALSAVQSSPDRFDLICDPVSGGENPQTFGMSVDIENDRWCYVDECRSSVHNFAAVEPNRLVLTHNSLAHYSIDRTTGRAVFDVGNGRLVIVYQCRRMPSTMPDRLF